MRLPREIAEEFATIVSFAQNAFLVLDEAISVLHFIGKQIFLVQFCLGRHGGVVLLNLPNGGELKAAAYFVIRFVAAGAQLVDQVSSGWECFFCVKLELFWGLLSISPTFPEFSRRLAFLSPLSLQERLPMNRVRDNIDKLISAELAAHSARLELFFERVQSNYDESIRAATRFFLLMLAAWFLTIAIKVGWIKKIEFFGLNLDCKMIVVSPFLIGLFSYGMLSAMAGAIVFWEALSQSVCKMLPTAWKHSLDDLLAPPTFSNIERMLEPRRKDKLLSLFSQVWFAFIGLTMLFGSLFAIGHTTHVFFAAQSPIAAVFGVASTLFGTIAWLRGFVLFTSAIKATGGFKVGHHRASGRTGV
jgi:hypothetical protein